MAVTTQLQSSLTLQTFTAQLNGGVADMVSTLEGGNPMALMLRPPRNYLGALDEYRLAELPRRSWFFDVQSGELVYLIGENGGATLLDGVAEFATDEIRLKIIAEYSLTERSTGLPLTLVEGSGREPSSEELSREFNGLVLAPVTPFRWRLGG
ncbi:MAG: hypothetical protein P1V29_11205 [Gammaproteobacteria bacterium]|nr:hypothetical protein [Gammaproteobacteria bacterium]